MNVLVKICGIKNLVDAEIAIQNGADYIGLNFVPASKRRISFGKAKNIIENIKRSTVQIVGVFQNQPAAKVNRISHELQLDYVQLHGSESPQYCQKISTKIIKVFPLESDFDPDEVLLSIQNYQVDYFLLDRGKQGEGPVLQRSLLKKIVEKYPIFIAGGLNTQNISETVRVVGPFAVDVSGGVERDGKIDFKKVRLFIKSAKSINHY